MNDVRTIYHRDRTVTIWDVYQQQWMRTDEPSDRVLASLSTDERERVIRHCCGATVSTKWQTVATVGYSGGVSSRHQNPAAAGGVCHLQARRSGKGMIGRKVNSNGNHQEVGESFPLDSERLAQWQTIERSSR